MNDKDKAKRQLIRELKQRIKESERNNGKDVNYLDYASWGYETGILLTPREAKLILTLLTHPTSDKN